MAGKRRTGFVDGYLIQRLREQERGWVREREQRESCPHSSELQGEGGKRFGYRHEGLLAQTTSACTGLQLPPKSQGLTLRTKTAHKVSTQVSDEMTLHKEEKYSRFNSLPTSRINNRSGDTSHMQRNRARVAHSLSPSATKRGLHSSSPSATRRGFRKIRRGYPATKTPPTLPRSVSHGSSRRSSVVGMATKTTPTERGSHRTCDLSLPLVGQRSEEIVSARRKLCEKDDEHLRKVVSCRQSLSSVGCDDNRVNGRAPDWLKKSSLTGARVGGANVWGCVGVRGWKSACEDVCEELMTISAEDSISIEGESSVGESGELGEGEEVGFSVEDLTDLEEEEEEEDGASASSSTRQHTEDHPPIDLPCEPDVDPASTYTLLQRASQQLELLSIASDSDGYSSSDTSTTNSTPLTRRPRRTKLVDHSRANQTGPRWTKVDENEPKSDQKPTLPEADPVDPGPTQGMVAGAHVKGTDELLPSSPLTPSLFPGLESTIHFPTPSEPYTPLPAALRSQLKWKMSSITPNVIKNCIARVGFTPSTKGGVWLGYWGKHMQSRAFRGVRPHQKVNHFPGSFEIGRKDRLCRNLCKLQTRVGKRNLDFVPLTFVLPHDLRLLRREWESAKVTRRQKWILKPPAAARGIGVRVVHRWNQIPKKRPIIVQRYIADPFLIRGSKIDLRVYVYVSSYDPLLIYVFPDGLTRFATCKYSSSTRSLSNRFIHLTNYSVNKKNAQFSQNPDETVCQGHKWGLLALWRYMSGELGIDAEAVWSSIVDVVIKTIVCSESHCSSLVKSYVQNSYSCHELFGFDVVLDRKLKPWLIEVNISPSLHSNSKLDINIKGQLARDLLNIAGFKLPTKYSAIDRAQQYVFTPAEKQKHSYFLQRGLPEHERRRILDNLTPGDISILMQAEDEFARRGMYQRAYPSHDSAKYRIYFESERYNNILLEQWLMKYRHCHEKGIQLLQRLAQQTSHVTHN